MCIFVQKAGRGEKRKIADEMYAVNPTQCVLDWLRFKLGLMPQSLSAFSFCEQQKSLLEANFLASNQTKKKKASVDLDIIPAGEGTTVAVQCRASHVKSVQGIQH